MVIFAIFDRNLRQNVQFSDEKSKFKKFPHQIFEISPEDTTCQFSASKAMQLAQITHFCTEKIRPFFQGTFPIVVKMFHTLLHVSVHKIKLLRDDKWFSPFWKLETQGYKICVIEAKVKFYPWTSPYTLKDLFNNVAFLHEKEKLFVKQI